MRRTHGHGCPGRPQRGRKPERGGKRRPLNSVNQPLTLIRNRDQPKLMLECSGTPESRGCLVRNLREHEMDFTAHEIRTGLIIATPILIIAGLAILRQWLHKDDAQVSATLQRRDE